MAGDVKGEPTFFQGSLLVFGGHDGSNFVRSAESFTPSSDRWREEGEMLDLRGHFASCVFNGKVWALGGWDPYSRDRMQREMTEAKALKSVEIYDTSKGEWSRGPDMVDRRAFHKAGVVGGQLMVVGGFDGVKDLAALDRLDLDRSQWIRGMNMRQPRSGLGVGTVRGRLYVFGGHDGLSCLGTVESLDPRQGVWREEPELLYHRAYPGSCAAGDCIFVCGGSSGKQYLNTVEMFDARKPKWRGLPSMNFNRNGAATALAGDTLYTMGGFDGTTEVLSVVEALDMTESFSTATWQVLPEMRSRRDGCAVESVTDSCMQLELTKRSGAK